MHPGADNQSLSYLLHRTVTGLRGKIIGELLPLNLTFPQYICLQSLAVEPDQSNADLARRVDVSPQAMNGVLRALLESGLVDRPATAETGRALPARLTARGAQTLQRADAAVRRVEERVLADLSHGQRTNLTSALIALASRNRTTVRRTARRHVEAINLRGAPDC
jgi:DNA-binding MarR family transcriptional regulator